MTDDLVTAAYDAPISVRSEEERLVELRDRPVGRDSASTAEGPERIRRGAFRGTTRRATWRSRRSAPHGAEPACGSPGGAVALEDRDDGQYGNIPRQPHARRRRAPRARARRCVPRCVGRVLSRSRVPHRRRRRDRASDGAARRVGIVERGAYPGAELLAVRSTREECHDAIRAAASQSPTPRPTRSRSDAARSRAADRRSVRVSTADAPASSSRGWSPCAPAAISSAGWRSSRRAPAAPAGRIAARALRIVRRLRRRRVRRPDARAAPGARRWPISSRATIPGVIPPSGRTEVAGILASAAARDHRARRARVARRLGHGARLAVPRSGAQPRYASSRSKPQRRRRSQSVKVKILKGSQPIDTYAGGTDVSYQLIRRSRPPYREAYLRDPRDRLRARRPRPHSRRSSSRSPARRSS